MRQIADTIVLLAVLLVAGSGCAPRSGTGWSVVVQAPPSTFQQATRFAVYPIDFSAIALPDVDRTAVEERFREALKKAAAVDGLDVSPSGTAPDAPFTIRVRAVRVDRGYYAGIGTEPAHVTLEVTVAPASGRPSDVIAIDSFSSLGFGFTSFTVNQRLSQCGTAGGEQLAVYLRARRAAAR